MAFFFLSELSITNTASTEHGNHPFQILIEEKFAHSASDTRARDIDIDIDIDIDSNYNYWKQLLDNVTFDDNTNDIQFSAFREKRKAYGFIVYVEFQYSVL